MTLKRRSVLVFLVVAAVGGVLFAGCAGAGLGDKGGLPDPTPSPTLPPLPTPTPITGPPPPPF